MKNYLLFGGSTYYANGGVNDLIDAFDSIDDAIFEGERLANNVKSSLSIDWWHIFSIKDCLMLKRSIQQPFGSLDLISNFIPKDLA